jgi:hypothetical protein
MESRVQSGDDVFADVVRQVVTLVTREQPLTGNQLFDLAGQLQRLAIHRIVEERTQPRQP